MAGRVRYDPEQVFSTDELETGEADVDVLRGLTPRPTQRRFLESRARHKAYIGNVGTGKTEVLVWQDMILQHLFPPNFTLIGRFTYEELRDTTRKRYIEVADPKLIATASLPENGGGYIDWKAGGRTIFRNLDDPNKFASLELGGAAVDEVSECPKSVWDMLDARVGRFFTGARRGTYAPLGAGGNPGGKDWVWKLFFKPDKDRNPLEFEGFHPAPRENEAALPPDYYRRLALGKPDWWIRRYIHGDLGALEGLVWPRFDEQLHGVDPFPIPKHWYRISGHDHGKRKPTAALWFCVDSDGNLIAYREYKKSGLVPAENAKAILRLDRNDTIARRIADPSMFSKTIPTPSSDKWHSVADEYELYGLELERGDNATTASLIRVDSLLWPDPSHPYPAWHPRAGRLGSPRLFFFKTCEMALEDVSSWRFKDYAIESLGLREEPVEINDDLCDCLRYVALAFPEPNPEERVVKEPTCEEWQRLRVKRISRAVRLEARERDEREAFGDSVEDYV